MDNTMFTENLMSENAALKAQVSELTKQVQWLIEQVKLGNKRQFGISSEKSGYDFAQLSIFN